MESSDSESYECECIFDSSDEEDDGDCSWCKKLAVDERHMGYFNTALMDVAGLDYDTLIHKTSTIVWADVLAACDVRWESTSLVIENKASGKRVEMDVPAYSCSDEPVSCTRFSFGMANLEFRGTYFFEDDTNAGTDLDAVLSRLLKLDRSLLLGFVRIYANWLLGFDTTTVTLVPDSNRVQIGDIRCTPTHLSLSRCRCLYNVDLDAETYAALQDVFLAAYNAHLLAALGRANAQIGQQEEQRRAGWKIQKQKVEEVARVKEKRAALWAAQEALEAHLKKAKVAESS